MSSASAGVQSCKRILEPGPESQAKKLHNDGSQPSGCAMPIELTSQSSPLISVSSHAGNLEGQSDAEEAASHQVTTSSVDSPIGLDAADALPPMRNSGKRHLIIRNLVEGGEVCSLQVQPSGTLMALFRMVKEKITPGVKFKLVLKGKTLRLTKKQTVQTAQIEGGDELHMIKLNDVLEDSSSEASSLDSYDSALGTNQIASWVQRKLQQEWLRKGSESRQGHTDQG